VQAEVLAGFLVALRQVEPAGPRVVQRLCSTAVVTARARLRVSEPARADVKAAAPGSVPPPAACGHPDFVLARAVAAGVITTAEADLIGATRLEDVAVADYAARHAKSYWAVHKARARAEERLVAAIRAGRLCDTDAEVIAEATATVAVDPTSIAEHRPGAWPLSCDCAARCPKQARSLYLQVRDNSRAGDHRPDPLTALTFRTVLAPSPLW
jgi:hypothetical protein